MNWERIIGDALLGDDSDSEAFASLDTGEWLCEACCQASDNAREHKGE